MDNSEKLALLNAQIEEKQAQLDSLIAERDSILEIEAETQRKLTEATAYKNAVDKTRNAINSSPTEPIRLLYPMWVTKGVYYLLYDKVWVSTTAGVCQKDTYKNLLTEYVENSGDNSFE